MQMRYTETTLDETLAKNKLKQSPFKGSKNSKSLCIQLTHNESYTKWYLELQQNSNKQLMVEKGWALSQNVINEDVGTST